MHGDELGHCRSPALPKLESDAHVLMRVGVCHILLSTTNSHLTPLTTQDIYHHCDDATTTYLHPDFILIYCDSDKHSCALWSQHLSARFYPVIHADGVKMWTFTPNANSSVACRGSERVVREGEGLSTLKTRGEIYPTCNQELENV